jgi:superfamily II DNA or RNA helicase
MEVGVAAGYVDAYTSPADRKELQKGFADGSIEVVCNVDVLTTGVDWDVRCLILARPTKSRMRYVQIIGRGLRSAGADTRLGVKDHCLIFDHSDTTETLGLVTDIQFHQLDDGSRKKKDEPQAGEVPKEKLPSECPACHMMKPAGLPVCPHCGFKPAPRSTVICADGELEELTVSVKTKPPTQADMQRWYSGLLFVAEQRGHKQQWADHAFKDKFKQWPRGLRADPLEPAPDIRGYVKHRDIKRAHSKRKFAGAS